MTLFEKIKTYTEKSGIKEKILNSDAVICAFSGGADSSLLLRFLLEYLRGTKVKLLACHVNHMIRGKDADDDENFCRAFCEKNNIEFYSLKYDVTKEAAQTGESVEEAARRIRYDYFKKIAEKTGENVLIATAHNATDNAETVIFNLVRGSSVKGIGGISPIRDNIVRPLLSVTGEEIRDFCNENGFGFVMDKTNESTDYTRNYIRHEILPKLKNINSKAEDAILRLSRFAREDDAFIEETAIRFIKDDLSFNRADFYEQSLPVKKRMIMLLCEKKSGRKDVSEKNISDAIDFINTGKNGKLTLHNTDLEVCKDIIFAKRKNEEKKDKPEKIILTLNKIEKFGDYQVGVLHKDCLTSVKMENVYKLSINKQFCCSKIECNIFVRTRMTKDTYLINGVNKNLKKLMCDEKISQRVRDYLPVFCDDDGIIWVPGLDICDRVKPKKSDINYYLFFAECDK